MSNAGDYDDNSASDESDEEDLKKQSSAPAGPVHPLKCTAAGNGISGGSAGDVVSFVVTLKDASGRRLLTGGAIISARVSPKDSSAESIKATVVDKGDGTVIVSYVVPTRGNYSVSVECNGLPIMGSPFPVFFSAPATGSSSVATPQLPLPVAPAAAPPLIPTPPVNPLLNPLLAQNALRGVLPGLSAFAGITTVPGLQSPYPGMVGGVLQGSSE